MIWQVLLIVSTVELAGQPSQPTRRYDVASPQGQEHLRLMAIAVEELKRLDTTSNPAVSWKKLANEHTENCKHESWFFLPWHRLYLAHFELLARGILKQKLIAGWETFAVPYWRFGYDTEGDALPRQVPDVFRVSGGQPGPLAEPRNNDKYSASAAASFSYAEMLGIYCGTTADKLLGYYQDGWRPGRIEKERHNELHDLLGSPNYIIRERQAALDPLFYVMHASVDRYWTIWLSQSGNKNTLLGSKYDTWRQATYRFIGAASDVSVQQALLMDNVYVGDPMTFPQCPNRGAEELLSTSFALTKPEDNLQIPTRPVDLLWVKLWDWRRRYLVVTLEGLTSEKGKTPSLALLLGDNEIGRVSLWTFGHPPANGIQRVDEVSLWLSLDSVLKLPGSWFDLFRLRLRHLNPDQVSTVTINRIKISLN